MTHQEVSIQSILVPLDGSPASEQALPMALDLATRYGAQLILLRVALRPEIWSLQGAPALEDRVDEHKALCLKYLHEVQSRLDSASLMVSVEYALGNPSHCIVDRSKELGCSLIVMNSHGRDGLTRWLLGSVAEKVVRHASCPVMLVRQSNPD